MNLRFASLATAVLIPIAASHAGQAPLLVHGTFQFSNNMDEGTTFVITPDNASLKMIPLKMVRKMKESGGPANFALDMGQMTEGRSATSKLLAQRLGVKEPVSDPEPDQEYCDLYSGSGTFAVTAFKIVPGDSEGDGPTENVVSARLVSIRDIHLEGKSCGKEGQDTHYIKISGAPVK